jgi:hypothetical protein
LTIAEGAIPNRISRKFVWKTIIALKPNKLQLTTIKPQANAIIERINKVINDILRSFSLQNNHENLENQEDNPFDYFLQSMVTKILESLILQHCRQHHVNLCLAEI